MPFFKYTAEFPYLHECPECEAQFVSIVPDAKAILYKVAYRNCMSCGRSRMFCRKQGSALPKLCQECKGYSNWIDKPVPKKRGKTQVDLIKSNHYNINGRVGVYELSTADGKSHCFHMNDTLKYEYFPIDSHIVEVKLQTHGGR